MRVGFLKLRTVREFALAPHIAWLLLVSQTINIAMLSSELTSWMMAIVALCFTWRGFMNYSNFSAPPKWLLVTVALCGCIALALSGRQLGVLLSMLHLLVFSYALKSLEMHKRQDFFQLFLLGLFVMASALIFSQTLLFSIVVIVLLIVNFSVLLCYFAPQLLLDKSALTLSLIHI